MIQSISFQTPPHINQRLPKMRGRSKIKDKEIITELQKIIEDLSDIECCFWACDGPTKLVTMKTCRKCQNIRILTMIIESLKLRGENKK